MHPLLIFSVHTSDLKLLSNRLCLLLQSIPIALEGKDLVAMARTGSGKTACFVLPILEKLIAPGNKAVSGKNLRALILSPTRELALQVCHSDLASKKRYNFVFNSSILTEQIDCNNTLRTYLNKDGAKWQ